MDTCTHPTGKCRTLLALLLTLTLPSCMTIGLWHLEDGPPQRVTQEVRTEGTRLIVAAHPTNLRIHSDDTPEQLTDRGLISLGFVDPGQPDNAVTYILLRNPELLQDRRIGVRGKLPLYGVIAGNADFVIRGTLDPAQLEHLPPADRNRIARAFGHAQTIDHRSTWRFSLNDVPQSGPKGRALVVPADLAIDIEHRARSASWPLRTAQVVLTPPALVLDLIVTPAAVIYYGMVAKHGFIF